MTIRDIAQRLGIAVSTVSKGLNGAPDVSAETRQLVLDTAVEMGYAAKRARRQAQPKVCVLVENMEYANIGQFGYEIVAGFRLAAAARGWAVDVLPTTPEAQARTKYGQPAAGGRIRRRLHSRPDAAGCIHACAGRHWHAHSAAGQLRSQRQRRICGHRQLGGRGARHAASGRIGTSENRLFERHAGFNGV